MNDPYGRNKVPLEPAKPKLFNPKTPFKLALYAWFMVMNWVFRLSWKELFDIRNFFGSVLLGILLSNALLSLPTVLVSFFLFGLGTGWIILAVIGMYLLHLFFFFAFQLHNKDSREYWFESLRA